MEALPRVVVPNTLEGAELDRVPILTSKSTTFRMGHPDIFVFD
jgi:hypothetical protein